MINKLKAVLHIIRNKNYLVLASNDQITIYNQVKVAERTKAYVNGVTFTKNTKEEMSEK